MAREQLEDLSPARALHPASIPEARLLADCTLRLTRRSGPGGQNRNKVETAVILEHRPTGVMAEANEKRHQGENRAAALFRLRVKLALTVRSRRTMSESPSDLWRSRIKGGRIAVSPSHEDFPAILAEALDVLSLCDDDPKRAAERLLCTPSQLVKFLKEEPRALADLNGRRVQSGLRPLL